MLKENKTVLREVVRIEFEEQHTRILLDKERDEWQKWEKEGDEVRYFPSTVSEKDKEVISEVLDFKKVECINQLHYKTNKGYILHLKGHMD